MKCISFILLKPSLIFICVHKYVFFKKYCLIFLFFWIDIKEAQDYSMLHVKTVYNITPCQASQHAPLPLLPSQKTRSYNNVLPYPLPLPEISHAGINKLWTGWDRSNKFWCLHITHRSYTIFNKVMNYL